MVSKPMIEKNIYINIKLIVSTTSKGLILKHIPTRHLLLLLMSSTYKLTALLMFQTLFP